MRRLHILIALLISFAFQLRSQEATAVLMDKQIKIGEQTTIELELRSTADGKVVSFPSLMDTISGKIEIVKISEIDTSYDENDISIRILSQTITITSWDSGYHPIPPFTFKVGDEIFSSEAELLEVTSVDIQAEADIKDIKGIIEVPFSLWDWILVHKYYIGGIILLIALIIAGIFIYKKLQKEKVEEQVFVPKEEADVVAIRQLKQLEEANLWQNGKINEYHTSLSHIIREYLENRYQISALEKTTDEIDLLLKYHKETKESLHLKLIDQLQLSDLAKFAKQQPSSSENEAAMKFSYQFIEETKVIVEEDSQLIQKEQEDE